MTVLGYNRTLESSLRSRFSLSFSEHEMVVDGMSMKWPGRRHQPQSTGGVSGAAPRTRMWAVLPGFPWTRLLVGRLVFLPPWPLCYFLRHVKRHSELHSIWESDFHFCLSVFLLFEGQPGVTNLYAMDDPPLSPTAESVIYMQSILASSQAGRFWKQSQCCRYIHTHTIINYSDKVTNCLLEPLRSLTWCLIIQIQLRG